MPLHILKIQLINYVMMCCWNPLSQLCIHHYSNNDNIESMEYHVLTSYEGYCPKIIDKSLIPVHMHASSHVCHHQQPCTDALSLILQSWHGGQRCNKSNTLDSILHEMLYHILYDKPNMIGVQHDLMLHSQIGIISGAFRRLLLTLHIDGLMGANQ